MAWLLQNWFWVLIAIIFVGVHLVGHGGHGGHGHGHGGHANEKVDEGDDPLHASHKDEQVSKSHDHQHKGGRSC
jgi:hypothetical protein